MSGREINELYFDYMRNLVCNNGYGQGLSWNKLFRLLHETEFIYSLDMDANRAYDGLDLRYRFAYEFGLSSHDVKQSMNDRPCSMMEMMVALALRCEEQIMDNTCYGDRTGKWFFKMIKSLRLTDMDDGRFHKETVRNILCQFMDREYDMNGHGGLFAIQYPKCDMRETEIWYQMMAYLEEDERNDEQQKNQGP